MNSNLLVDLSKLTCTKENVFEYLNDLSRLDICQCVLSSMKLNESADIDIGIGTLNITVVDDELLFSFEPSNDLKSALINSIDSNTSDLQKQIEARISNRMIKLYKELI